MKYQYRLNVESDAGHGTRREWYPGHFKTLDAAHAAQQRINKTGWKWATICVLFEGELNWTDVEARG